jgi:hypothetical protein
VSQYEDLGVLGRVAPGEQHKPAQHASEHRVGESKGHSDSITPIGDGRSSPRLGGHEGAGQEA